MTDSGLNSKAVRRGHAEDVKNELRSELISSPDLRQSCMEEREHLQVYLRIRPFTSAERTSGESQDCVTIEPPDTVLLKPPSLSLLARLSSEKCLPQTGQRFQFSKVYGPQTTQNELFEGTVKDLVKDVLEGGNSLVFTYGVTNSGKTFTFLGPDSDAGVLPRSLDVIFSSIDEQVYPGASVKPHRCREFTRLSREQQVEEALFKKNLLRQSEKSNTSMLNVTNQTLLDGSTMTGTSSAEDKISLKVEANTKFSVWVSFCEIYNENIHDLLEVAPNGALRRTALRLSQDIQGNAFVKDLRWVQVNSAEEVYKVVKLGRKNQSFSSTRLNHLSSRSHSIFTIRILRIEDIETPQVHTSSELCLCDLAGSERSAKTLNQGERLKEAGNINTSLLILGKCINALRHNQQAKLLQHVPFRESKLTHYLQGFFCGRGKACMIVNINQCASMYDETLNALKFSAVAQKVVVLSSRPPPIMPQTSSSETSFIQTSETKAFTSSKGSSLIGYESSLEDVQEDENEELLNLVSFLEDTMDQTGNDGENDIINISKKTHQQVALVKQLQVQLKKERAANLLLEARIREEISREFSELFSEMQNDYDERLAREREILEERAERRLEIFKNLINNMPIAGLKQDTETMDKLLDSHASELMGLKNLTDAACMCSVSVQTVQQADRSDAVEKPEMVLDLKDHHHQQDTQNGKTPLQGGSVENEEKQRLLLQLQEKSPEVARLEKQLGDLQRVKELDSHSRLTPVKEESRDQLKEALAALAKERKEREDTLAALEYQTLGKEEALASLEEERKAREEAIATLQELRRHKEEMLASLEEQRGHEEKAASALEAERRAREDAAAALEQEKQSREETHAALCEERRSREEVRSALEVEREKRQQEGDALRQEVRQLTDKLETAEQQVKTQTERAEQALVLLTAVQAQHDQQCKETQEKTSEISALKLKVQRLQQELETPELKAKMSELRNDLNKEKEKNEMKQTQIQELERQLEEMKLLVSEQHLSQTEGDSKVKELRKKLQEQEKTSQEQLDELRAHLESQQQAFKQEADQLRGKLQEQTQASEKQMEQLDEKLRQQEVLSKQQLEDLEQKLSEEKETSSKCAEDLKQMLRHQEKAAEQLKAELIEAQYNNTTVSASSEELKRINSDLLAEVSCLKEKLSSMEETMESCSKTETEQIIKDQDRQTEEKLAELEKASALREAEIQKKLQETEGQVASLQKSLREAVERREEEDIQAVQEARRREAERRRELLAVAHEAIDQKDAELEKRAQEISRLKEKAQQDSEKVKSLSLELQRKDDDSSDLREKLADYKKQIQQVQKEISTMREEEKVLKQKLTDMEKSRKQLQSDVTTRDRTIQQLRAEQSNTKSDHTLELYQKACKDLEAKEHVMEAMRLALTEQEDTQEQMEQVLEDKLKDIQELSGELQKLKVVILQQSRGNVTHQRVDSPSEDLRLAKEKASQAQESLTTFTEKHQAERKKWLEEKLSLIGQAKEAEDKRNQEMRKFAEDRERYTRQQSHLESQLVEKEQTMENWRKERDTLVSALEVQLKKLLSSQAEKDELIRELRGQNSQPPREVNDGCVAELKAALIEREAEILQLKEALEASTAKWDGSVTQSKSSVSPTTLAGKSKDKSVNRKPEMTNARASVSSQSSAGFPSVLESSEISTENGKTSRFPRPELEISFSPLQPNRMALRRQGEESSVTVKITRTSARKRKSGEMEKSHFFRRSKRRATPEEEVEAENRRNTRSKLTPKLTPHKEEGCSPAGSYNSHSSVQSRKEGTLQKIGEFLQCSPTLLGTKAKKMMGLVSSRVDADSPDSSSSLRLRAKKSKKKLYRPSISSPMEMPPHPIISRDTEEKESDHQLIKRRLRSRKAK
ncbi:kinesin-like protein KIF20B isoform X2 [Kryptolebias marmoratus]|uniref:kinesin-like protein KIF20B isoform X2 n=1 Tax=Kryptolebias marmoratus TaxID=37003 RepID=UPI000D530DEE|nr:kinesin-like protein KIF20B isoform X2 [Kryptolebias marmoratus]